MTILLLIFIYIFYIGLGIPDSLLGTAWPAIYAEFHAPISYVSFVSMIISGGTVASSLLSARIIAKLGTPKVTALSTQLHFWAFPVPRIFSGCVCARFHWVSAPALSTLR